MKIFRNIDDAQVDRLFGGQEPEDSRLEGVAQFLRALDSEHPEQPTAALEATHVAAMLAAAQDVAENSEATAGAPASRQSKWSAAAVFGNMGAHRWATAATASVIAVLALGGAAYAGALPAPLQRATASFVHQVGITVPSPPVVAQTNPISLHQLSIAKANVGSKPANTIAEHGSGSAGSSSTGSASTGFSGHSSGGTSALATSTSKAVASNLTASVQPGTSASASTTKKHRRAKTGTASSAGASTSQSSTAPAKAKHHKGRHRGKARAKAKATETSSTSQSVSSGETRRTVQGRHRSSRESGG